MLLDAAFSSFPVLCTHRFHLRRIQPSDAEAFFQINSDPEVTVSYGREPHRSLQDTQAWIQRLQIVTPTAKQSCGRLPPRLATLSSALALTRESGFSLGAINWGTAYLRFNGDGNESSGGGLSHHSSRPGEA
jgi:hypothetical protein